MALHKVFPNRKTTRFFYPVTAHVICHQKNCTNEHKPIHIGEKIESVVVLSTYHGIMKSIVTYKKA